MFNTQIDWMWIYIVDLGEIKSNKTYISSLGPSTDLPDNMKRSSTFLSVMSVNSAFDIEIVKEHFWYPECDRQTGYTSVVYKYI